MWIEGEIANLNYHGTGHIYFSLRDKEASLNCTFFRRQNAAFRQVKLQEGLFIQALGDISSYAARSSYQFNVSAVKLAGEGDLRQQIEILKKKLFVEGLFKPEKKRPLPAMPLTLGVVTAAGGAAFQDIRKVALKRFPSLNIILAPCLVQGKDAAASIVEALRLIQDPAHGVDVVICGRGGGSFADLMPFSTESVVRAVAACSIPIISAVGHQIDNPLTDLAADVAAPTPTAAAQMAIPEEETFLERLLEYQWRCQSAVRRLFQNYSQRFERVSSSRIFENPAAMLEHAGQRLDFAARDLRQACRERLMLARQAMIGVARPTLAFERLLQKGRSRVDLESERLQNYSPRATLDRGYAIVRNASGIVVRTANIVQAGEALDIILGHGGLEVEVKSHASNPLFTHPD